MSDVEDSSGGGTSVNPPVRIKETGVTSVACPMLNQTNYMVWSLRMKVVLRIHKVWSVIDPGEANEEKDYLAMGLLYQAIPETLIMQIGDAENSKTLWASIRSRHIGADRVKEARLQTLNTDFDRLRMSESESIDSFAGKLSALASKSASLGEQIEESKLVKKMMKVVPRRYIHLVASLEQVLDLKTVGFDDVVGRLKAFEERIKEEDGSDGHQRVMFTREGGGGGWSTGGAGGSSSGSKTKGRGKWKGAAGSTGFNQAGSGGSGESGSSGSGGSGPNRFWTKPAQNSNQPTNKPNFNSNSNRNSKKDLSKIICYRCDKSGHYASKCPDRLQKFQESNFTEHDDADETVFLHEKVFLNEEKVIPSRYNSQENDVWYLDNGASNHMTGNRSFFSELDEGITGRVKFGDNSSVEIKGKGSILFQGKSGQQRLMTEIYFIPDLKNNIFSLGQATEAGCDIRMKDDYLTMHDADNCLLMKVQRSSNRLYKIKLSFGEPICLHSKLSEDTWSWHARLGHINFELMKKMSKNGLVKGLPHFDNEKQKADILTKPLARTKFKKIRSLIGNEDVSRRT